jgi:hydroxyacylglutathione hydrolase
MKSMWVCLVLAVAPAHADSSGALAEKVWIHGAQDCRRNTDPAIDIFKFDESTFVLRQNKCLHYEAPFIYVLFGEHTVFVQDTGATAQADEFPLYQTIRTLVDQWQAVRDSTEMRLLVTHSHGHSDHTAGDPQFRDKPGVTLIEPTLQSVHQYFGLNDWPGGSAIVDLGGRELVVFPIPGHHDQSVAVYDPRTRWLLSGDSFYPGRLYVKDWDPFRASIQRMMEFSETHEVSALMGTHIEMSDKPGEAYPAGSTYQPDEAGLALSVEDLRQLNRALEELGPEPEEMTMPKFIVAPIGILQRVVNGIVEWMRDED